MAQEQEKGHFLKELATEVLDTFESIAHTAQEALRQGDSLSMESLVHANTIQSQKISASVARINQEKRSSCETLLREPAIARVKTVDEEGEKIFYICRATPITGTRNLASYRAPIGRLAALPLGDEFTLPNGTVVEVIERSELKPAKVQNEWDSVDTHINSDLAGRLSVESLRALLESATISEAEEDLLALLIAGESQTANVREGIRRSVITKMGLRDQPILDQYQDEIFRLPLDSRLLILGPPGTGKTTTLIRRLGQKLDQEFLDDDERHIVDMANQGSGFAHADSWLMFTPTELLKQYLKESFAREGVAASDQRIKTWVDYRRVLARNTFGILKTAAGGGSLVLKENLASITEDAVTNPIDWFNDFYEWQSGRFNEELENAAETLSTQADTKAVKLGQQLKGIFSGTSNNNAGAMLSALVALLGDARELRKEQKEATDKTIKGSLNLQLNRDRSFVDELVKFIETIQEEMEDETDDIDDQEMDEEVSDVSSTDRMKAINTYMRAVRTKARSLAKKRSIAKTSRNGRILEWLEDRIPDTDKLEEIGNSLVLQDNLALFVNPVRRYISRIPSRYRIFRRLRQKEKRWYQVDGFAAAELNPLELDVILLGMLKAGNELLSRTSIARDIEDEAWSPLIAIRDLHRHQILVDEVTDFSPIQIGCMSALSHPRMRSFFACGDFNQRMTVWGARDIDQMKWVLPDIDTREITVSYRQSRQLNELARAIIEAAGGEAKHVALPDQVDNEGVAPVLLEQEGSRSGVITWLADRIREIERFVGQLPSIAVFVESEAKVQSLADDLNGALEEENAQVVACPKGQVMGQDNDVRIFDVQHIKGLEFEAVFFIGVDRLANEHPELFDKYLYVGTTRAATYLGLTCQDSLPQTIETLRPRFVSDWSQV